ncbi:hypothetical protein EON77_15080 [bacterium]|nr:MAG: hypothetical protein EON77_15080 [bacterium]
MNEPSAELIATVSTSLVKLVDAGFAHFGEIRKDDPVAMMGKAETYAEALMPDEDERFPRVICCECVTLATRRLCRTPARKEGKQNPIPSAGEFRRYCEEAWAEVYRHVGVPVLQDGIEVASIIAVRRDARPREVASLIARAKADALREGCKPVPAALPAPTPTTEVRARMHKMLGWEAPVA